MVIDTVDLMELIRKAESDQADIDFLREGVATLARALMEVDVTAQIGAGHSERNPDGRATRRNGYRTRRWAPARARWSWRSPSCARAATTRTGCWSRAAAPRRRWRAW